MNFKDIQKMEQGDLLEKRGQIIARQEEIRKSTVENGEERALNDMEVQELTQLRSDLSLVELEIEQRNRRQSEQPKPQKRNAQPTLTQMLRGIAGGKVTDEMGEVFERGLEDMKSAGISAAKGFNISMEERALMTAKGDPGTTIIETERKGILAPLERELILSKLGANFATGLRGNVEFIKGTSVTAEWAQENAKASDSNPSWSKITFTPKRLTSKVEVSNMLLAQDSIGVEDYLRNQIYLAIRKKLEETFLGTAAGSATQPVGLLNGAISDKGEASYERIIDMITKLDENGALEDGAKFVTTPVGLAVLAKTPVHDPQSLGFITSIRDKNILGYDALTSSNAAKVNSDEQPLIFANWRDMFIGQWGGLNIIADTVTRADEDVTRFIVNCYFDGGFIRDESVVKASFKMKSPGK